MAASILRHTCHARVLYEPIYPNEIATNSFGSWNKNLSFPETLYEFPEVVCTATLPLQVGLPVHQCRKFEGNLAEAIRAIRSYRRGSGDPFFKKFQLPRLPQC